MTYKQSGNLIFSEAGPVCQLSDPSVDLLTHKAPSPYPPVWEAAMANGKRIIEAEDCLSQVQSHAAAAGLSWQEWIETAAVAVEAGVKLARGEE